MVSLINRSALKNGVMIEILGKFFRVIMIPLLLKIFYIHRDHYVIKFIPEPSKEQLFIQKPFTKQNQQSNTKNPPKLVQQPLWQPYGKSFRKQNTNFWRDLA